MDKRIKDNARSLRYHAAASHPPPPRCERSDRRHDRGRARNGGNRRESRLLFDIVKADILDPRRPAAEKQSSPRRQGENARGGNSLPPALPWFI